MDQEIVTTPIEPKTATEASFGEALKESFPQQIRILIENKLKNQLQIVDQDNKPIVESSLNKENFLGRGLRGLVLQGKSETYGQVALKLFTNNQSVNGPESQKAFADEEYILNGLDHPNIAKFFGVGKIKLTERSEVQVILRELAPYTLKDILKKHGILGVGEVVQMAYQIADALEYLNKQKKALMTDLTPENLSKRDDDTFLLVDTGDMVTKKTLITDRVGVDDKYTAPEILLAPEKDRANTVSLQSEVYSLGLVAYFCLTGKEPNPMDTFLGTPANVSQRYLSDDIFAVIKKATSTKPIDRFQTPSEFAEALKTAAFPQPQVNI